MDSWDQLSSAGAPPPPPPTRLTLPAPLAAALGERFHLLGELGRGGMGVVYRARERSSGREVALKLVLDRGGDDAVRRERFRREGELAAKLDHPGIVRVHAAGEAGGVPWLSCELVEGARGLDQVLPELPLRVRVVLIRDVARALGEAHARGVVHRDVKPQNVLVDAGGRARLTDFGLAAARGLERLTRSGVLVGTPFFMAPEQIAAERAEVGPRSDVWALGVILYQALTGTLPFRGDDLIQLARGICEEAPLSPRELVPSLHPGLVAVCLKALAKQPAMRHADGAAFAADLDLWLGDRRPGPGARPGAAGVAAALVGLTVVVACALLVLRGADESGGGAAGSRVALALSAPPASHTVDTGITLALAVDPPDGAVTVERGSWRGRGRAADGRCEVWVPLEPGRNRVVARGPDGAGLVELEVERRELPAWLRELPAARRPPVFPAGVDAQAAALEYLNQQDRSTLVWVHPGRALLGSDFAESGMSASGNFLAARQEEVERGFFLGKHEVTWKQWGAFCRASGREPPSRAIDDDGRQNDLEALVAGERPALPWRPTVAGDDHPVFRVTWGEARDYCAWAGGRLPSELEWEYAARGSDGRAFPWGNEANDVARRGNAGDADDGFPGTAPVGSFPEGASPFGALDMGGNVFEWVGETLAPPPISPRGVQLERVTRGGAWNCFPILLRSYFRDGYRAEARHTFVGLRLCRPLPP